jgi:hypothetical protein
MLGARSITDEKLSLAVGTRIHQPWIMVPMIASNAVSRGGLGLLLIALVACGGAANGSRDAAMLSRVVVSDTAPPLATAANGLFPGESMTFTVALGGVECGEAALAVGDAGVVEGKRSIVVTSRVATAGAARMVRVIDDELTSTIALETGLPTQISADVVFGSKNYHADGRFEGPNVELTWHRNDEKVRHTRYDFGKVDAHDAHTAMAAMRTWEGNDGESRRLYVIGGRRIWRTDVTWTGRETIGTKLGNQPSIRLDGISVRVAGTLQPEPGKKPRSFTVWMSDDADRVPLKVIAHTELGDVIIELTGYERP